MLRFRTLFVILWLFWGFSAHLSAQRQPPPIRWEDWGKAPLPDVYLQSHLKIQVVGAPANSSFVWENGKAIVSADTSAVKVELRSEPSDTGTTHWIVLDLPWSYGQKCSGDTSAIHLSALEWKNGTARVVSVASINIYHHFYLPTAHLKRELFIQMLPTSPEHPDTLYLIYPILEADTNPIHRIEPYQFKPVWAVQVRTDNGTYSGTMTGWNDCGGYQSYCRIPCKPDPIPSEILKKERYLKFSLEPQLSYYSHPCGYYTLPLSSTDEFWYDWHTRQVVER